MKTWASFVFFPFYNREFFSFLQLLANLDEVYMLPTGGVVYMFIQQKQNSSVSYIIHSLLFDISPTTTPTQESEEHLLDG